MLSSISTKSAATRPSTTAHASANAVRVSAPKAAPRPLARGSKISALPAESISQIADGIDTYSLVFGAGLGSVAAALGSVATTLGLKSAGSVEAADTTGLAPVTEAEVLEVQSKWAGAIKNISKVYKEGGDFVAAAAEAAGELYAYGHSDVLFKPTKAAEYQFRPTPEEAMSYFVGGDAVEGGYKEDGGFAINGGKGFAQCLYDNHKVELTGGIGLAMGNYYFTCATTGDLSKVEYTFGYKRCEDGKVRIFLHHSSVPFAAPGPAAVTEEEVLEVQSKWAGAIQNISKIYKEGGDYVSAAAEAAGELYAYGHHDVLFKPTKAAEYQFRPTPEEAMSYFIGGKQVEDGYDEDAGFAINGGKGFAECLYDNHKVDLVGGIGLAMGNYYFTCDTTGDVSKVEYTFGYRRCEDGKVRIFLHHSSVPFAAPVGEPVQEKSFWAKVWSGTGPVVQNS